MLKRLLTRSGPSEAPAIDAMGLLLALEWKRRFGQASAETPTPQGNQTRAVVESGTITSSGAAGAPGGPSDNGKC